MLQRALRLVGSKAQQSRVTLCGAPPRRRMGDWLHKNIRAEENAGLREASYKTWEFDFSSIPRLVGYMFVPGLLFYVLAVEENKVKDAQIGKKTPGYGIIPKSG